MLIVVYNTITPKTLVLREWNFFEYRLGFLPSNSLENPEFWKIPQKIPRAFFAQNVFLVCSANDNLAVWVGGLDSLDTRKMKGICTKGHNDSNPKPPGPNSPIY